MRINENIFFSPSLLLKDLDLSNKKLVVESFKERIESYFFQPVELLNKNKQAFASGAILCLLIDALSRYSTLEDKPGPRIRNWCIENLSLSEKKSEEFYSFFRCGLLHESHIKCFGQFTYDNQFILPIQEYNGFILVNPISLCYEIRNYFNSFIEELFRDEQLYSIFISRISIDFENEVQASNHRDNYQESSQ
jgi:hypothetical protein